MNQTAHYDTFSRNNLPPADQWPDFLFELEGLNFPPRLNCAGELLDKNLNRGLGEKTAIYAGAGEAWSYARLWQTSNRIAHVLVDDFGLVPGNRVLLRAANSPMLVACWFAVLKAGGIAVTTMPMMRCRDLVPIIEKAQVSLAICEQQLSGDLREAMGSTQSLRHIATFGGADSGLIEESLEAKLSTKRENFENVNTASDDVALIAFTSGTTGNPKGTMHFHRDVMAMALCFSEKVLKPTHEDIFIGSPPLAFTFGLGALVIFPMHCGATTVLLEKGGPEQLAAAIEHSAATICFTSPTGYRGMLECLSNYSLATLKSCVSAGEHLQLSTFEAWEKATGIRLIDGIGATEMIHIFISAAGNDIRPGSTGKVVPGYQACVLDTNHQPLPPGESGWLAVKGPTGCRYLADDRQSNYVVNGWNITGDIYYLDQDGYFWYVGRGDDMIISSGYNISGTEVEDALLEHPSVSECAVVAAPHKKRGNIAKAFVVPISGVNRDSALIKDLQDHVKSCIAPYKYPRAIEFVDELPKTETGKVQRFKLRELARGPLS